MRVKNKKCLAWCVAGFLLLFVSFSANIFGTNWFGSQRVSELVVIKTAECQKSISGGIHYDGLYKTAAGQPYEVMLENGCENASERFQPYPVQYALQARVVSAFAPSDPVQQQSYFSGMKIVFAFLTATVLFIFALTVNREFGKVAAVTTLLAICASDWIVAFASDLYWAAFLMFLPFVFSFTAYKWFVRRKQIWVFYVILGIIFWLKFLDGYEHATTLVLSAFIPIMYFELKNKIDWQQLWRPAAYVAAASVIGLAAAYYMNVVSLQQYYGSWDKAVSTMNERADDRWNYKKHQASVPIVFKATLPDLYGAIDAVYDLDPLAAGQAHPLKYALLSLINYLMLPAITLPIAFNEPIGTILQSILCVSVVAAILLRYLHKKDVAGVNIRAITAMYLAGIVGAFSWLFLFPGHTYPHAFLNGIIFYIPLLLVCYIIIGLAIQVRFFPTNALKRKATVSLQ